MSILPPFKASYKKLVLPKLGFTSTLILVSSSISILYILINISGSAPIFPAITNLSFDIFPIGKKLIVKATTAASNDAKIVFGFLSCKNLIINPNTIAKTADEIAPIKINAELFLSIPSKINEPNPPAPIKESCCTNNHNTRSSNTTH